MTLFISVCAFIAGVVVCAVAEEYFGKNTSPDTMSDEWRRANRGGYTPRNN